MKLIIFLLSIFIFQGIKAQYDPLRQFIQSGYSILDSAKCDLNKDGNADYIMILKSDSEETFPDTTRSLIVLMGKKNGTLEIFAKNDKIVSCRGCGGVFGDPYSGITIRDNYFSIEHYGGSSWRWTRIITFKYDFKLRKIFLHKDAGDSFHVSNPDKIEFNTYNKESWSKVEFEKYNAID
jgi:hypothetical protein